MSSLVQHNWAHRAEIDFRLVQIYRGWRAILGSAAILLVSVPALAATAPSFGTTSTYAVVSSTFTNNGNPTNITGDVCTSTMSGSAAPVASIAGAYTTGSCNGAHATMGTDFTGALATLNGAGQGCINVNALTGGGAGTLNTVVVPGGTPAGTFPPGCYSVTGAMSIPAGTVTLSGAGVYIFKSTGTLDTSTGTSVAVSGGACEADVFWAPNGATTLATTASFKGSILDGIGNAITVGTTTSIVGRLLSFGGVVTTDTDTISVPTCATAYTPPSGTLITRYRLYSDYTKEHLYTTDANEYSVLPVCCGWLAEGAIYRLFQGPGSLPGVAAVPYYRLYNPYSHQHHWTFDANEYGVLATVGWKQEGIDGYILPSVASGSVPLYRLYLNAFGGLHLWTIDANEKNVLTTSNGWVDEGVAGYVVPLQ